MKAEKNDYPFYYPLRLSFLACIGIALGFVSIVTGHIGSIFSVVVNGLILYYIYRPNVKSFFGKTTATTAATASMTR